MTEQLQPTPLETEPKRVRRKRSRGQSIVELALILPLMLTFLLIAGDFGRALTAYMTVSSAASEGASFASRSADNAATDGPIEDAARNEVGADGEIWDDPITVLVSRGTDGQSYPWVTVTVDYTFRPMFSPWLMPDTVPMERSVRMRVLGN